MKRLARYAGGVLGAVAGFILGFAAYYTLREFGLVIAWGGDHAGVVLGVNLGIPIGGTAGIVLVSRMVFKSRCWHALGISASLIGGFIGVRLCIFLGSELGLREKVLVAIPFISVFLSLVALQLVNSRSLGKSRCGLGSADAEGDKKPDS